MAKRVVRTSSQSHYSSALQNGLRLWRPVLASASAGTLNRASAIGVRLVTVPLLLRYLGPERYGLWMTIASTTAYLTLLDLGTVSALTNRLTRCYAAGRIRAARAYVASATIGLSIAATIGLCVALAVIFAIDWRSAFELRSAVAAAEARPTLVVATTLGAIQLVFAAVLRLPYTMQRGALSEGYQLAGNVGSLVGIITAVQAGLGLPWLALALMAGPVVAGGGVLIHLVVTAQLSAPRLSWLRHWLIIRSLARAGGAFVVMQVAATLLFALQFPILAASHGAAAVAPYALLTQVMLGLQTPLTVLQQPLWTRYAALRARNDMDGVRSIIRQYMGIAVIYSVITAVVLLTLVNPILALLAKATVASFGLRAAFALLCALGLVGGGNLGAALLALDLSRSMATISIVQLAVFLVVASAIVPPLGAVGMALSACAIYFVGLPPIFAVLRRRLAELSRGYPSVASCPVRR